MLDRGKKNNFDQLDNDFMQKMRELDERTARERQLEREGVNKLNWYRATHKEDKKTIEKLQIDHDALQSRHNEKISELARLAGENEGLIAERDQLLARVAELEKGIQEGGDLVE